MTEQTIIMLVGLMLTAFGTVIGTTWRVRRELDTRDRIMVKMMTDHELADAARFSMVNERIAQTSTSLTAQFGDTGRALREHMHGIEMNLEKTNTANLQSFVRRDSFFHFVEELNRKFDVLRETHTEKTI